MSPQNTQTWSGSHPLSYSMRTGGSCHNDKMSRAWNWPLSLILRSWIIGALPPFPIRFHNVYSSNFTLRIKKPKLPQGSFYKWSLRLNGTENSCGGRYIVAPCSFVHLHRLYRRISCLLHHARLGGCKWREFVRQKYRYTSVHVGTHRQTSVYIGTHWFTSAHIGTHRQTSVYIGTHRFTSAHVGTHRHTSVYVGTHRFTSARVGTHRYTSVQIGTRRYTRNSNRHKSVYIDTCRYTSIDVGTRRYTSAYIDTHK